MKQHGMLPKLQRTSASAPSTLSSLFNSPSFTFSLLGSLPSTLPLSPSRHDPLLKSCISRRAILPGKQIHAHLTVTGLGLDVAIATKLLSLYCLCGSPSTAHRLFNLIPKEKKNNNLFIWNVLIRGYAWNGPHQAALSLYARMLRRGLLPNAFTFPFVLKACAALAALKEGREVHQHAIRAGLEKHVFVGAALIDMYAKCGRVENAREVFEKMPVRDAVVWSSMIAAYSLNRRSEEALKFFSEMASSTVAATRLMYTEATLITIISAASDIPAVHQGREVHGFAWRHGFHSNAKLNTTLVNMYAKGGSVSAAHILFESLAEKGVVSWNSMITGYAMHGHAMEALSLFEEMVGRGQTRPDHITFVGVLSACRQGRLLDEGWKYFNLMKMNYGIEPMVQHYTCMVDLLGHCNRLDEAYSLILEMKVLPDAGVWGILLNSCKINGNLELGEVALERLAQLEPGNAGNYMILCNMYAQVGRWDGVVRLRRLMTDRCLNGSNMCGGWD